MFAFRVRKSCLETDFAGYNSVSSFRAVSVSLQTAIPEGESFSVKPHTKFFKSVRDSKPFPLKPATLFLGLFAALALSGCNTTGKTTTGGGAVSGASSENYRTPTANIFRYPLTSDPTTLDPAKIEDGTTIDLMQQVFEGLVKWDEQNKIAPNIAEKWELSADGKTYTFHLKHGVKFHHGREITASDFKYSLERACDPALNSPITGYMRDIVGVKERLKDKATGVKEISGLKVVDPYTLQITIDAFKPYWLGNLTYPCYFVVCKEAVEKKNGVIDESNAVGTGPFSVEPGDYRHGYQVKLTANPEYHGGKPILEAIIRPILQDAGTRLSKYAADEIDMVEIAPSDLERVNKDDKLKADLKPLPRARIWYLAMNQVPVDSPFKKLEVRQAFAMAIDKKELLKVALHDEADLAEGIVPPGVPGANRSIKPLGFNPAQAKVLLAKGGYPDGKGFPNITFSYRNDRQDVADVSDVIRQQLKVNLGIEVQSHPMAWADFLKERHDKTLPLTTASWGADYFDPQNFQSTLLHTDNIIDGKPDHEENGIGYSNAEFDKLCDAADIEHDPVKRMAMYQKAEQIAVTDAPWLPLFFQRDLVLMKPRVTGYRNGLLGILPHLTTTVKP